MRLSALSALVLFLVPLAVEAQRAPVRMYDPVSQPINRQAFTDRVNELSTAMDALSPAGSTVPVRKVGKVTVPSSGAWVDLYRFAPGNSKKGAVFVQLHGETSAPSYLTAMDRFEFETSVSGSVFLLGPYGNPDNTGGASIPGTPAAPTTVVNASNIVVTWAAVTPVAERGWQAQVSIDAGSTWSNIGNRFYNRKATSATFSGLAGAMAAVKLRVRGFNARGFSAWSAVKDETTGASHGSEALPPSQLEHWPLPITEAAFDDLEGGHFYGVSRIGASGGTGDLIVQVVPAAAELVVRAKTQNSKTGVVRFILDLPPQ